ncbi:TPA: restriction endonuclease subunit S, partial [Streptococcus suis]
LMVKVGFLFGAGAELSYGMPTGGKFALEIFRRDASGAKKIFKENRDRVVDTSQYASNWLPEEYQSKKVTTFRESVYENIIKDTVTNNRSEIVRRINQFDEVAKSVLNNRGIPIHNFRADVKSDIGKEYSEININQQLKYNHVGTFFSTLDQHITLHQRKLDTLKEQKKTYLKLLFPAKGQTKPALRFQGFEDDWEVKRISDIGDIVTGNTPSTSNEDYYSNEGMMWVTPTDIDGLIITDTNKKLSPEGEKVSRIVPANSILVTCIASIGKNTLLLEAGSFNQQINAVVPNQSLYHSYFLLTQSYFWSESMKRIAPAATMQII